MMKVVSIIIAGLFLALLLAQIYLFSGRTAAVRAKEEALSGELVQTKDEQSKLQSDLNYY